MYKFAPLIFLLCFLWSYQTRCGNYFDKNYKEAIANQLIKEDKKNAFSYATSWDDIEIIAYLLAKGEDINGQDTQGVTPLLNACWYRKEQAALFLIEKGADIHAKDTDGRTALHWSVENGLLKVIELLLKKGAVINMKDNEGNTPLHLIYLVWKWGPSCKNEVVKLLMKNGADFYAEDKKGITPFDLKEFQLSAKNKRNKKRFERRLVLSSSCSTLPAICSLLPLPTLIFN